MGSLLRDVMYGARMLLKNYAFSVSAIVTLALGIGATTAVFSLVNSILVRQLPIEKPERVASIWLADSFLSRSPFSIPDLIDIRDRSQSLEDIAAYTDWSVNLTGLGQPERLQGNIATPNIFQLLGVKALIGRTLIPEDCEAGGHVVVLSYGLWQRRFGAEISVIGMPLTLNDQAYTVVGVLPLQFSFPGLKTELWAPLDLNTHSSRGDRGANFFRVIGLLRPGVGYEHAKAEMSQTARDLQQLYPKTNGRKEGVKIVSLKEEIVGDLNLALIALFGAVIVVLVIACVNLANLLLARASARHQEMAIRRSLGASRMRLVRQLLTESIILALIGGLFGFFLALASMKVLISLNPAALPRMEEISIDLYAVAFTFALSLVTGIIFGVAPAFHTSNADITTELRTAGRGSSGGTGRKRLRGLLVVSEVALALILLAGAGLLIRSFARLQDVNLGFDGSKLLTVQLAFPETRYESPDAVATFFDRLSPRIEGLPGVQGVSAVSILPLSGLRAGVSFTIEGRPPLTNREVPSGQYRITAPGYFRTMGIPLLTGREFNDQDISKSAGVAIINEAMANRFWPDGAAIGSHLRIDDQEPTPRQVEVVGVVGNVKQFTLDGEPTLDIYVPYKQIPDVVLDWAVRNMSVIIRSDSDPSALMDSIGREIQATDSGVPPTSSGPISHFVSASLAARRFNLLLLTAFAVVALLLASAGIYAVISYSVTQRTNEIGIRMALGAQQHDVLRLVVVQGMKPVIVGELAGLAAAIVLAQAGNLGNLTSKLLFNTSASDPAILALVSVLLAGVALISCWLPAMRAAQVDPTIALRGE